MGTLRTLADKSTGEDKRCVVEKVEEVRKAIVGLRKQARGEDLQRVAELEESLKRLEEEMLPCSVEEQEQRRQGEQRRQEEQEQRRQEEQEQRRQEEREHAAMRNVATSARMAAKRTAVTSATAEAGDESTDETRRKGKGKGNGGKGEHEGKGGGFGRKGTQQVEKSVMDEDQGNTGAMRSVEEEDHREDVRKLVEMMLKEEEEQEEQRGRVAPNMEAGGSHHQAMSVPERKETQGMRWADCEDDEGKEEEERRMQEAQGEKRVQEA